MNPAAPVTSQVPGFAWMRARSALSVGMHAWCASAV
jgi:hypothetical protein